MKKFVLFIACLVTAFSACGETETQNKTGVEFPSLQDGKADYRTRYYTEVRQNVELGTPVNDHYEGDVRYYGYTFILEEGDQISVDAGANGDEFDTVIGIYGPQRPSGAWGGLIDANDDYDGTNSHLEFEANKAGTYLVLVREYYGHSGDFWLTINCTGGTCDEPVQCPIDGLVCALWCPNGFKSDENGCALCQCSDEPLPLLCAPAEPFDGVCAQVIAYGKNPATGECCQYPTPCNVPAGYEVFYNQQSCEDADTEPACTEGETRPVGDGCNTCTCSNGDWSCTELFCGPGDECVQDSDCVRTGCSGQLCAADHMITTCEWREEYACYQQASCGCNNGYCGFSGLDPTCFE